MQLLSFGAINLSLLILIAGSVLISYSVYQVRSLFNCADESSIAWIHPGKGGSANHLTLVIDVLNYLGYRVDISQQAPARWDFLWSHEYPFTKNEIRNEVIMASTHKKVNKFPGSGFITSKVELSLSQHHNMPRAFRIPADMHAFGTYAAQSADSMWVIKKNDHRGIKIMQAADLLDSTESTNDSFIQQFIPNPLLIDGHKFDIGVYTLMTSVKPLRVYTYQSNFLLRFCSEKYEPFDSKNADKYVVGDDYIPPWQIPSLKPYIEQGYSYKHALQNYIEKTLNKSFDAILQQINNAIRIVYESKQNSIVTSTSNFPNRDQNFFEMVRIDFILDENLNIHLMEANMSPNLSNSHFAPLKTMFHQIIFGLFQITGVAHHFGTRKLLRDLTADNSIEVDDHELAIYVSKCQAECTNCFSSAFCQLCQHCMPKETIGVLKKAYLEHVNRHTFQRLLPKEKPIQDSVLHDTNVSPSNQLTLENIHDFWFTAKCASESSWCAV